MAHNRAERRKKAALIKRKLERKVQKELASNTRLGRPRGLDHHYSHTEHAIRRRRFKNEGRQGRCCWECGHRACGWCLDGFYRKHIRRARALEYDLQAYLNGDYDALREEGVTIPDAFLVTVPRPMQKCVSKGR